MNGDKRRESILQQLVESSLPISGLQLAKLLYVSRQVIVQDIALLRAEKHDILSTNTGYIIKKALKPQRVFCVSHSDDCILDELYTIVDLGGRVVDVQINHKVYGNFLAQLNIKSRKDAENLVERISLGESIPLKKLTQDTHCHLVEADTIEELNSIENELRRKGYLMLANSLGKE
ncbi:putative transcription repressor NiaR [bioreactor metagenome]|mgnify:FL=1|uniref:Putative transcription repressor NiaR n=1 Tax=bioreactor metagenome TaxID=1076179 RepID=A0A644ZAJ5_9ZZZZ